MRLRDANLCDDVRSLLEVGARCRDLRLGEELVDQPDPDVVTPVFSMFFRECGKKQTNAESKRRRGSERVKAGRRKTKENVE